MIAGALALGALMAVNVQVGMNDGSTTDVSLLGLEASVFAPAAVATYGDCSTGQRSCIESGMTATTGPMEQDVGFALPDVYAVTIG